MYKDTFATRYVDESNDGLFGRKETHLKLNGKERNLLTFEADVINMMGLGNIVPENLSGFIRDFLINKEK